MVLSSSVRTLLTFPLLTLVVMIDLRTQAYQRSSNMLLSPTMDEVLISRIEEGSGTAKVFVAIYSADDNQFVGTDCYVGDQYKIDFYLRADEVDPKYNNVTTIELTQKLDEGEIKILFTQKVDDLFAITEVTALPNQEMTNLVKLTRSVGSKLISDLVVKIGETTLDNSEFSKFILTATHLTAPSEGERKLVEGDNIIFYVVLTG